MNNIGLSFAIHPFMWGFGVFYNPDNNYRSVCLGCFSLHIWGYHKD